MALEQQSYGDFEILISVRGGGGGGKSTEAYSRLQLSLYKCNHAFLRIEGGSGSNVELSREMKISENLGVQYDFQRHCQDLTYYYLGIIRSFLIVFSTNRPDVRPDPD
jgi:hypothetical protein